VSLQPLFVRLPPRANFLAVLLFSLLSLSALSFPLLPEHQKELHVSNPSHHSIALSKASSNPSPLPLRKASACPLTGSCSQHTWTDAEENDVVEIMHKHHSHVMGINLLQEDEAKQTSIKLKVWLLVHQQKEPRLTAPSSFSRLRAIVYCDRTT